jgi:hypothetical protein
MSISVDYIVSSLRAINGEKIITSQMIKSWCDLNGIGYQTVTKKIEQYKVGRGQWDLTVSEAREQLEETIKSSSPSPAIIDQNQLVPDKNKNFVSFGNFKFIKKIIQSGMFYPTFITGLSGNGKTFSVEQACAQTKREFIRINITVETDEDDLIGGFRLIDGNTVWHNGPVIEALERGAILLLDEIDLASNKILCLQSILEGNGVFLKKVGKWVKPNKGFNVFATANTKGKGSEDGRFIGTNVLNEAFLERFPVTFEQEYPSNKTEFNILSKVAGECAVNDPDFLQRLVDWSESIRKLFYDGGVDEIISTRRLVHIVRAYGIFKNKEESIKVCVNRFDDDTKQAFIELYDKFDPNFVMEPEEGGEARIEVSDANYAPF